MSKLAIHFFDDTLRSEEFQDACEAIFVHPDPFSEFSGSYAGGAIWYEFEEVKCHRGLERREVVHQPCKCSEGVSWAIDEEVEGSEGIVELVAESFVGRCVWEGWGGYGDVRTGLVLGVDMDSNL